MRNYRLPTVCSWVLPPPNQFIALQPEGHATDFCEGDARRFPKLWLIESSLLPQKLGPLCETQTYDAQLHMRNQKNLNMETAIVNQDDPSPRTVQLLLHLPVSRELRRFQVEIDFLASNVTRWPWRLHQQVFLFPWLEIPSCPSSGIGNITKHLLICT